MVLDKEKLLEKDSKDSNKKKRFKIRYQLENYYQNKNIETDNKKEGSLNTKLSYERYKTTDRRGYDIINFENNFEHYKNSLDIKKDASDWDNLIQKVGPKETFNSKGIYKDPFDFQDKDPSAHAFKNARLKYIENLPKIKEDNVYKINPSKIKIIKSESESNIGGNIIDAGGLKDGNLLSKSSTIPRKNNFDNNINFSSEINKANWFKNNKDNNMSTQNSGVICYIKMDPKERIMRGSLVSRKKGMF